MIGRSFTNCNSKAISPRLSLKLSYERRQHAGVKAGGITRKEIPWDARFDQQEGLGVVY